MKIYKNKGIYGTKKIYRLESLEDFDEYESILLKIEDDYIRKYNPNFYEFKKDFEKYFGKIWYDKRDIVKEPDGTSTYKVYKLIALEDDHSNLDWYWIAQNLSDSKETKCILANSNEIRLGLKKDELNNL